MTNKLKCQLPTVRTSTGSVRTAPTVLGGAETQTDLGASFSTRHVALYEPCAKVFLAFDISGSAS